MQVRDEMKERERERVFKKQTKRKKNNGATWSKAPGYPTKTKSSPRLFPTHPAFVIYLCYLTNDKIKGDNLATPSPL